MARFLFAAVAVLSTHSAWAMQNSWDPGGALRPTDPPKTLRPFSLDNPRNAAKEAEGWMRLAPDGSVRTEPARTHVDLRPDGALEALQRVNPNHFRQVRHVLVRMRQAPSAGPERWFPIHIRVRDIEFSELSMRPVFPPRHLLRFTLDDVRYTVETPRVYPGSRPRSPRSHMQSPH